MKFNTHRRDALVGLGAGFVVSRLARSDVANAAVGTMLAPAGAKNLRDLSRMLAGMPRRRNFHSVPMILDDPDLWDQAPLAAVLAYAGGPRQAWDNTDLAGSWLNGMRNTVNSQVWSFKEPDFLCVSATHGSAHLALFDQDMWNKYQFGKLAAGNPGRNTYIEAPPVSSRDPEDFQAAEGPFSSKGSSIVVLQRRGVVFMGCHNTIWELAERLAGAEQNPDRLGVGAIAAELTNHLIPDVILTPGIAATLVKLQQAGFAYSR